MLLKQLDGLVGFTDSFALLLLQRFAIILLFRFHLCAKFTDDLKQLLILFLETGNGTEKDEVVGDDSFDVLRGLRGGIFFKLFIGGNAGILQAPKFLQKGLDLSTEIIELLGEEFVLAGTLDKFWPLSTAAVAFASRSARACASCVAS